MKLKTLLNHKLKIVVIILGVVGFWMISGLRQKTEKPQITVFAEKMKPQFVASQAILKNKYLTTNAIVKAKNFIRVSSEISGLVKQKFVKEGQRVKVGDLLFTIENETVAGRIDMGKSSLKVAQMQYDTIDKLFKKGLSSKLALEDALANLNNAKTNLAAAETLLNQTRIKAPFSGTINDIYVLPGDFVNPASGRNILAAIVNLDDDEITAYISSKEKALLNGVNQLVRIYNNKGHSVMSRISAVSNTADEATSTYKVTAYTKNDVKLFDGETVTMQILLGKFMSHKVPLSALIIDKDGNLAVKRIEGEKILTDNVEIVDEEEGAVWITGLPEKSNIILVGHYYAEDR